MVDIATGAFLGGVTKQRNKRREQEMQLGRLGLEQAAAQSEERQQLLTETRERISARIDLAQQTIDNAIQQDKGPDNPAVRGVVERLKTDAVEIANAASSAGFNVNPAFVGRQFDVLLTQPSSEQLLAQETKETRATAQAKAEGTAAGAPQTTARVVSGNTPMGQQLGIPPGESARVEFDVTDDNQLSNPRVVAGFGGSDTNVSVNVGSDAFAKEFSKAQAERLNKIVDTGTQAIGTERNLLQMGQLLNEGVETGRLQSATLSLQGLSAGFGVDLEDAAKSLNINLGDLSSKEQFNRLARKVMIDGFEKFKGNLNRQEVRIAEEAFASLGDSRDANADAISAGLAAQQIARERAIDASQVTSPSEARALERQILSENSDRFLELKEDFKSELSGTPRTRPSLPEGIPDGSELIQETDGKQFYRAPDGKVLVVE